MKVKFNNSNIVTMMIMMIIMMKNTEDLKNKTTL